MAQFLYRSRTNKKIAGICGGLGEYFAIDPILFRLLWLGTVSIAGTGILLYLMAWIVIPQQSEQAVAPSSEVPVLFYRSRKNRIIAGICGGLGEYLDVDPVIFRLLFVGLTFACGWGLLLYLTAWLLVPIEPRPDFGATRGSHAHFPSDIGK